MIDIEAVRRVLFNKGPLTLLHAGWWYVWRRTFRRLMPITEPNPRLIDEVKFLNHTKPARRLGDGLMRWRMDTYGQNGEVNAHKRYTREGDHVCIVGGGRGTTAVHAARQVGVDGAVTVFEGGNIASLVEEVAEINHVDDLVKVRKVIIGEPTTLYQGMAEDAEFILPSEVPACDVLEMDCEGSELAILTEMQIRPRVLIVELHPSKYDAPNTAPLEQIEEMGYGMTYWSTQRGDRMSEADFVDRLADGFGDVLAATRD